MGADGEFVERVSSEVVVAAAWTSFAGSWLPERQPTKLPTWSPLQNASDATWRRLTALIDTGLAVMAASRTEHSNRELYA